MNAIPYSRLHPEEIFVVVTDRKTTNGVFGADVVETQRAQKCPICDGKGRLAA